MSEKKIVVKSTVTARRSSDFKQVVRKAVAGFSEAELIEKNSIGTYEEDDKDGDDGTKKKN